MATIGLGKHLKKFSSSAVDANNVGGGANQTLFDKESVGKWSEVKKKVSTNIYI
ncbi:hypothetical protein ACJMK2_016352, partial [Sinanodonta woodiana]